MSEGDGRAKAGHEHASEDALIAARRAKAERIRARPAGDDNRPFANDVCARTPGGPDEGPAPLGEVHRACAGALTDAAKRRYDPAKVEPRPFRVAGRVLFMRSFGGISFVRLRDRTGELQLFVEETSPCAARLEDIDLGDVVEATGVAIATQKGELSIRPERLRVLTKAYRPLPTKTSFKDVESRYRQRYVDLVANPDVMAVFKARTRIVAAVRKFLDARGFYEVETPTMVSLIGGAAAKPFSTHHNALGLDLYLRIAPELFLKRLVVGGIERVYEVARCYRNEGLSTRHNPEFTMLEYYQAYATYETLMDQTEQMLRFVDDELGADPELGAEHEAWRAKRSWSFERFVRLPMHEGIARALEAAGLPAEVPARVAAADAPIKDWAKAAKANKRDIDWTNYRTGAKKCDSPGELVFCAYEYLVEPFLPRDYRTTDGQKSVPVFVIDYPFEVSPLARKKDADPALVDRFELFVDGRELCNAFSELNDPDDQADRFRAQVARKQKGDEEAMDFDADYIRALEHGMPPAAGFGMGVDRLTMLLTGAASIRDVILFPLLRPEAG